jgi:hypothetical protein
VAASYNTNAHKFTLMADRCILRSKPAVTRIMKALNLPDETEMLPDDHYRCPKCLRQKPANK